MNPIRLSLLATALALPAAVRADTFGSGVNTFAIDFVTVGNAGNADDVNNPFPGAGDRGTPYGGVAYEYRMGVTEVPQDWITKATNLGMSNVTAGAWPENQPAGDMTWYEAAAFVNWLNTSTGHQAAYQLDAGATTLTLWSSGQAWQAGGQNLYRHKDTFYFLPNEDEWYKAAFHKNDGVTANYWDYATGSNTIPDGIDFNGDTTFEAVFHQGYFQYPPNVVTNVGLASPYGTVGQNGNEWEWLESAYAAPNDNPSEDRSLRGGNSVSSEDVMRAETRFVATADSSSWDVSFRVASVPEPTSVSLLALTALAAATRRPRRTGC